MDPQRSAPLRYRARASTGSVVLADSDAAVRVDVPGDVPVLWFPRTDVRSEALGGLDAGLWQGGDDDLADHVAFDHESVDVVVIDARPGDDERDVTVKRFPTWGDAADLIDVMDVRPDGERRYLSPARSDGRRPVVEGSQMLGPGDRGRRAPRARRGGWCRRRWSSPAPPTPRAPYAIELDPISERPDVHRPRRPRRAGRPDLRRRHAAPRRHRARRHPPRRARFPTCPARTSRRRTTCR